MIRVDVFLPLEYNDEIIVAAVEEKLGISLPEKADPHLLRLAVDGDGQKGIRFKASVGVSLDEFTEMRLTKRRKYAFPVPDLTYELPKKACAVRPTLDAFSQSSALVSSSKTSWVIPNLSLRSIKTMPPILRAFCTQPANVTS